MKTRLAAIAVGFTLLMGATSASAITLYDGTLGQTLAQQGWLYLKTSNPTPPMAQVTTNGTLLDTGDSSNYAGYFRQGPFPVAQNTQNTFQLDRTSGYTISFSLNIHSETHSNNNRAGFSVIVMSKLLPGETQPYGIELDFWENSIWAQNVGFTHGESVAVNTSATTKSYVLKIQGNQYELLTSNTAPPILQGSLRRYTGFTPPPGYRNPYSTPNLIFLGDDTTSARSQVTINRVSASPLTQIQ